MYREMHYMHRGVNHADQTMMSVWVDTNYKTALTPPNIIALQKHYMKFIARHKQPCLGCFGCHASTSTFHCLIIYQLAAANGERLQALIWPCQIRLSGVEIMWCNTQSDMMELYGMLQTYSESTFTYSKHMFVLQPQLLSSEYSYV